jgi:hypothetical protein
MADDETEAVEPEPMDNLTKAFALARLGIKVFPVQSSNRQPYGGGHGFYEGTSDDFEKIATWFSMDYPESTTEVGVWTGGSGLVAVDIDRKNGKNGFHRIREAGREVNPTEHYNTQTNGQHWIYQTDRVDLAPDTDILGMEGVDLRVGGSYVVWWGNTVPESRDAFSTDIPAWVIEAGVRESTAFSGEGFSGTVNDWLEAIPDDLMPSMRVRDFMARIPETDFSHPQMVELAWSIVRLGSERETGVKMALDKLRAAWLRGPYDTPAYRRDFDLALRGGINKGGRVQKPAPAMITFSSALKKADEAGIGDDLRLLERKVSETSSEIDFARARREMFKLAAHAGMNPSAALGIVTGSKAFKNSKVSVESTWFGDGESEYHDKAAADEAEEETPDSIDEAEAEAAKVMSLSADAAAFTFLTEGEQTTADAYKWWGKEYLEFVQSRLKHFNKPYHVSAMIAVLSLIVSPWGKVQSQGGAATDCNLYVAALGESTSGKSESLNFATDMIDAYFGTEDSPIIGDISKLSALALHRALILRDGKPSMVFGDEIQSFFQGVSNSQWQSGILGDVSSHYGGRVNPKLTLNDKEISGKRAQTLFTTYLTGIADQTLDALNLTNWTNGFLYRYLWSFGEPRRESDFDIVFSKGGAADYTAKFEEWAREFKRASAYQEALWGHGREVEWDEDARLRMGAFSKQIDSVVRPDPLYKEVFVSSNVRFQTSILKFATLVALAEASEKVTLNHVLVAIKFAGPWHRSMVLAVSETAKDPFDREVEKVMEWIERNAVRQVGKAAWIQRSTVMRAFKPNEIADRYLRQLTEEGRLVKSGDKYDLTGE